MKKLMILGAGVYQAPLIRQAKEMGLFTIAVSCPGDYPGFALADQALFLDTRDRAGILEAARREKIDGVCTSGTDVAVASIGYVCERMGLYGLRLSAAENVTDKWRMKEAFCRGGVCTPPFEKISSPAQARQAARRLGYPLAVKAVDSSGSRGVTIVKEEGQLEAAFWEAMKVSKKGYALAEAFVKAHEIGVDGFVKDGRLTFFAPHEKYMFRSDKASAPAGHRFPYWASPKLLREIYRQTQLAAKATGLDACPVNADVLTDGEKVWILEIGGRTGATCIPELIFLHYGFSFYEKIIANALGEPVDFPAPPASACAPCEGRLLMSPADGVISRVDEAGLDRLRQAGAQIVVDYPAGHEVEAMKNGTNRIGHVIAQAETREEFQKVYDAAQSCIWIGDETLRRLNERAGKGGEGNE